MSNTNAWRITVENKTILNQNVTWDEVLNFLDYPVITETLQFQNQTAHLITAKGKMKPITAVACDRFKTGTYGILSTFTDPFKPQNLQHTYSSVKEKLTKYYPDHTIDCIYASSCGGYQRLVVTVKHNEFTGTISKLFVDTSINGKVTNRISANLFTGDNDDMYLEQGLEFGLVLTDEIMDRIVEIVKTHDIRLDLTDKYHSIRFVEKSPIPSVYKKKLIEMINAVSGDELSDASFYHLMSVAFEKLSDNPERMHSIRKDIISFRQK